MNKYRFTVSYTTECTQEVEVEAASEHEALDLLIECDEDSVDFTEAPDASYASNEAGCLTWTSIDGEGGTSTVHMSRHKIRKQLGKIIEKAQSNKREAQAEAQFTQNLADQP